MPQDIHPYAEEHSVPHDYRGDQASKTFKLLAAGSSGEAIAGGAAVILAILGLVGVLPFYMLTIAVICAGGAMFLEGSAIASQFKQLEKHIVESTETEVTLGGGMAFEVIGGIAGIVLGILALVGVATGPLVAVASIVMGSALLLGAGATERLDKVRTHWHVPQSSKSEWIHDSVLGAAGLQVLAGLAGVTLGILALTGIAPTTLLLVSMLCIGGAVLLAGAAIAGEMGTAIRH